MASKPISIGASLTLGGASEYKKELSAIISEQKLLTSE